MTVEEARELLPRYADGVLMPEKIPELEAILSSAPELRGELERLREENELLHQALAPLRSSKSGRMKIAEAMQEVHLRAQQVAETLPEYGWRIFRLSFAFLSLAAAVVLSQLYPPSVSVMQESYILYCTIVTAFALGLLFVLAGRLLARLEAGFLMRISRHSADPSPLESLTLEVFGLLATLTALVAYLFLLNH